MTKVKPLLGRTGKPVANQYVIKADNNKYNYEIFQSYDSSIALKNLVTDSIFLDLKYWNYSVTTSKYRNQFLNETTKETQAKINSGEYKLVDLNTNLLTNYI
jgi:hypothetical protein|tara:strand:+ start:373 stop:678 length:306 start_codon:yes stop_codon:yes gene_type:complete